MSNSTYVPANSTYLYQDYGLLNGSLFQQINISGLPSPYSGGRINGNVNITILPNDLASLTFDASDTSSQDFTTLGLANVVLGNDYFRVPVYCVYPLSGQYDVLPRALFYLLLIVSLVFRRHILISTAALGTAMTYSATAVIHLFALLATFKWSSDLLIGNAQSAKKFGDPDLLAIFPILSAAGIMLAPILSWSQTVRRHNAYAVIICWGILIFTALIPAWIYTTKGFELDELLSFAACPIPDSPSDSACNADGMLDISYELYYHCQCTDFCATLSPKAAMRSNTNMVVWLERRISIKAFDSKKLDVLVKVNYLIMPLILLYGILGILGTSGPAAVRNSLFNFLNADRETWIQNLFQGSRQARFLRRLSYSDPTAGRRLFRKGRYLFAKIIATIFYLVSLSGVLICPAVFILSVVANELYVGLLPSSEHHDSVGSWGPWVSAALVIVAVFINRYAGAIIVTLRLALESIWSVFRYSKLERQEFGSSVSTPKENFSSRLYKMRREVYSPFQHSWHSIRRAVRSVRVHWAEFFFWWKRTKEASHYTAKEIKAWQKKKIPKLMCACALCAGQREKRAQKKSELLQQPYDSNDSDDDAELRTVHDYLRKRVKRRLGPDYDILRKYKKKGDSTEFTTQDPFRDPTAFEPTAYSPSIKPPSSPIYEHLLKRVKRRLGNEYEIVHVPNLPGIPMQPMSTSFSHQSQEESFTLHHPPRAFTRSATEQSLPESQTSLISPHLT